MLKIEQITESLIKHEIINSTNEKKKKKDLALKSSTHENDGDDDENEEELYSPESSNDFLSDREKV